METVYGDGSHACIAAVKLDFTLDSPETVVICLVPLELD